MTAFGCSAAIHWPGRRMPCRPLWSLPCTALTASASWYASRSLAKRELMFRPKSGSGNTILTVGKDPSGEAGRANSTARHRLQLKRVRVLQDQTEGPGAIIRSPHRRELANVAEH
jgi:hypothetical protein